MVKKLVSTLNMVNFSILNLLCVQSKVSGYTLLLSKPRTMLYMYFEIRSFVCTGISCFIFKIKKNSRRKHSDSIQIYTCHFTCSFPISHCPPEPSCLHLPFCFPVTHLLFLSFSPRPSLGTLLSCASQSPFFHCLHINIYIHFRGIFLNLKVLVS